MEYLTGIIAIIMVFGTPITIVWIIMHYKAKGRQNAGLTADESQQLQELNELAEQMAERIKTLESILDAESPEWREYDGGH